MISLHDSDIVSVAFTADGDAILSFGDVGGAPSTAVFLILRDVVCVERDGGRSGAVVGELVVSGDFGSERGIELCVERKCASVEIFLQQMGVDSRMPSGIWNIKCGSYFAWSWGASPR